MPTNVEAGNASAIAMVAVPSPQPTSRTRMPDCSRATRLGHGRQPLGDEQVAERRTEEPLEADEQPRVVLVPAETLAAGVPVRQLVDGRPDRGEHLEARGHERRAVLVGQDQRVLGRQGERLRGRVVGHVAGGRLRGQPLPHVALGVAERAAPARRWCCPDGPPGPATGRVGSPGRRASVLWPMPRSVTIFVANASTLASSMPVALRLLTVWSADRWWSCRSSRRDGPGWSAVDDHAEGGRWHERCRRERRLLGGRDSGMTVPMGRMDA